jgi:PhzF family phenazine biosynthesis protein
MKVQVELVNAFIDGDCGGNAAGVVLDADALTHQQKLAVAQAVGLSETAFVSRSAVADFKLDFYTPQRQIAHCGHATIAAFSLLAQLGRVPAEQTSKETIDGVRKVSVADNLAFMEQRAPQFSDVDKDMPQVLAALGITADDVVGRPMRVNTGNSFILLGLKSIAALERIVPAQQLINELSEQYDLIGFYVFTTETNLAGRDASTRMFAPRYGIAEESATGMAAGPLACYLHDIVGITKDTFLIEQGYAMQPASPSVIRVSLTRHQQQITGLFAGGGAKRTAQKQIELE